MFKELNGKKYELDEDGYLKDWKAWDEDLAKAFAEELEIGELNENHWKVIKYLREYFEKNEVSPSLRKITKESGVSTKEMYSLFPNGPAKKAAKVAGLTKPKGCI
jgi:tRNA 2-thiouridine synthesizing protein E